MLFGDSLSELTGISHDYLFLVVITFEKLSTKT